mgnify:CR=1 FL=1
MVDAVAGIAEYKAPMLIFDLGTANTVSVIDSKKNYIGGNDLSGYRRVLGLFNRKSSTASWNWAGSPNDMIAKIP